MRGKIHSKQGVSVAICCYNSAKTLPTTLSYLFKQEVPEDIPWEIIIVDNASIDGTGELARKYGCKMDSRWSLPHTTIRGGNDRGNRSLPRTTIRGGDDTIPPLRVVTEPKLGLVYARYKALEVSKYEFISFIDDDNWLNADWVKNVSEVMAGHPDVGACGGFIEPAFECEPPAWFELCKDAYAIGPQGEPGDITETRGRLVGAGLTIRKEAWQELINLGFRNKLVGHKGKNLSRGEDTELCYALRLAEWKLWYEPRLRLKHYLSKDRLQWEHVRKIRRGGGEASTVSDAYFYALNKNKMCLFERFLFKYAIDWRIRLLVTLTKLFSKPIKLYLSFFSALEGDRDVLLIEKRIGRLLELSKRRKEYNKSFEEIKGIFKAKG